MDSRVGKRGGKSKLLVLLVTLTLTLSFTSGPVSTRAQVALQVANVDGGAVACVWATGSPCTYYTDDTVSTVPSFTGANSTHKISSYTVQGAKGAPAEGLFTYQYRINLIGATGSSCISSLIVWFGQLVSFDFNKDGNKEQVFVMTTGSGGDIGLASASQNSDRLTFNFATPVCTGHSTFTFGVLSSDRPVISPAAMTTGSGDLVANVRSSISRTTPPSTTSMSATAGTITSAGTAGTSASGSQSIVPPNTISAVTSSAQSTSSNIALGFDPMLAIGIAVLVATTIIAVILLMRRKPSVNLAKATAPPFSQTMPSPRAAAKYCINCGALIPETSRFCGKCGSTQQ